MYIQDQKLSEDFGHYSIDSSDVSKTSQYVLQNMFCQHVFLWRADNHASVTSA